MTDKEVAQILCQHLKDIPYDNRQLHLALSIAISNLNRTERMLDQLEAINATGEETEMITEAQVQGLGKFGNFEFTLEHDGCEAVLLRHEGELVGRFYQTGATPESLQAECSKHLVMKHGWDGCLWQEKVLDG